MSRLAFHSVLLVSILISHNGWAEEVQTTIPPRFDSLVVDYDVEIPMRDGVVLFADVYRPRGVGGPISTILIRAPYGKREPYIFLPAQGRFWARRGFAFVAQDVRGKYASARDADFVHSVHELEDGHDTLEWIAKQPWSNGSVGQTGESYMGYTSLASMASKHPALKCIAPGMTSTDWTITDYQQGAPALKASGGWYLDLDAEAWQDTSKVNYWDLPLAALGKNAGIKDTMFIEWLRNPRSKLAIKADRFVYDPADPVALTTTYSPWTIAQDLPDRKVLEDREDILFYHSPPLKTDLKVTGPMKVVLYASTSAVDTDFTAVLVDLHPDGYAHQVQFGIVRASYRDGIDERKLVQPDRIYEYEIDLWATSYLFRQGHQLRVEISSSNFDHYARNLNNGEPIGFGDRIVKATQTVHHSSQYPSRLVFWAID